MAKQLMPRALVPIFWCCCILPCLFFCCLGCPQQERAALLDFKQGLHSVGKLESWKGLNCCTWQGVSCHPHTGHVISLDLSHPLSVGQYRAGAKSWIEVRAGLFQLSRLEHLDLSGMIAFSIPSGLGNLTKLRFLNLAGCGLDGQIPDDVSRLQQLEHLDLHYNGFGGAIPDEIAKLSSLKFLDLSWNLFSGSVPREIGNISSLKFLDLSWNSFNGSVPREIGNISGLKFLDLSWNSFDGSVLREIGNISGLKFLDLSRNSFDGSVPREIGNISSLKFLDLSYNDRDLVGSKLNEWIKHLRGLKHLGLAWVNLTANGDKWGEEIVSLSNLNTLDMHSCGLSGVIPLSIGNLSKLEELDLSGNAFRGNSFRDTISTSFFNLSENSLSGTIPTSFANLHKLTQLDLSGNSLSGTIPTSFANLHKLTVLFFLKTD